MILPTDDAVDWWQLNGACTCPLPPSDESFANEAMVMVNGWVN